MGVAFGADLDRDGIPDPIVAEVTPARARSERLVLVSSVSGIALHSYPVTDVRRLRSIVDVNGDGTRDVLASAPAVELVLSGADLSLIQSVDVLTLTKPPNATDVAEIDGEFCLLGWIDLHCYETHEYEERLVCVSLESSTLRWEYSERGSDSSDSAVVTTCGDVDGDGVRDVLVGWPLFLSDAVHVHSGRNGALLRYDQRPFDHYGLAHFGTDVASLPDVDGDGVDDYATSDVQQGNQSPGRVHFVSGKTGAVLDSFGAVRLMSRGLAWL
ncbi:MAG: hypothetical protein EPO68_08240 [Planctomycetota bacterium]|nr:MAG: hypothetical protein EPO68_08240 [Planctomycetota bacterium]